MFILVFLPNFYFGTVTEISYWVVLLRQLFVSEFFSQNSRFLCMDCLVKELTIELGLNVSIEANM